MTEKPKKHRSPNYPYIGLPDALEKAEAIRLAAGTNPLGLASAMHAWDYKEGSANSAIAALKAFGLLDVAGNGKQRQIKLTEVARKILADHSEKPDLLKKAALSPSLYKEVWERYNGSLPSLDKVISEYLVFERNFNPSVVDSFIKDFRATIAYANLSASDKIELEDGGELPEFEDESPDDEVNDSGSKIRKAMTLPKGIMFKASVEMNEGGHLNVVFAGEASRQTMALLNEIYQLCDKYDPQPENPNIDRVGNSVLTSAGGEVGNG
ncbi:MAG: hypothetical protein IPL32_02565 [Chloracidobacterium sp.]|nr:hypothetical protein [Chloracidobacterium sp.]